MITEVKQFLQDSMGESAQEHPYYQFEPWDIEKPYKKNILELAKQFGIDFEDAHLIKTIGKAPREFQTGYMFSDAFIRIMFAGNQLGKTFCILVDKIIRLTAEVPLALRMPKGQDTFQLRAITSNNIKRFGRINKADGKIIDHDEEAEKNSLLWDCGTIKGAGEYPKKRIAPPGSKIWIVTYKQARDEAWWPMLKGMIPTHLLDRSKGSQMEPGFDNSEHIVYLQRGTSIHFITYEQGATRLEAAGNLQEFENLAEIVFDEEPPDDTYYSVAMQRVSAISLITTPYMGLSWTYDDIFLKAADSPDIEIFHATQFDCPYKTEAEVMVKLRNTKKWQVAARIFGLHSEQSGRPYYEEMYEQIGTKIRQAHAAFDLMKIYPSFTWDHPMDIARKRSQIVLVDANETDRDAWEIYERAKPDTAYFMSVDTAEGSEDEKQEQDRHSAHVFRLPTENEPDWPVQVATIDSGVECDQFAPLCLYACGYYNNCMIAPESVGKSAGIFLLLTRDWMYKYTMTVINDITKKPTEKYGFSTQASNRTLVFDLVGQMMKDCAELPMFGLRQSKVLAQISGTIVGKGGRPDHKKRKRNDALMALGIGYYVYKNSKETILDHADAFAKDNKMGAFERYAKREQETRPVLGGKGLDSRQQHIGRW